MNVFNTWNIFGVCGIYFRFKKNEKHIQTQSERANQKKSAEVILYPINEKLCCSKSFSKSFNSFFYSSFFSFLFNFQPYIFVQAIVIVFDCNGMENVRKYVNSTCVCWRHRYGPTHKTRWKWIKWQQKVISAFIKSLATTFNFLLMNWGYQFHKNEFSNGKVKMPKMDITWKGPLLSTSLNGNKSTGQ